MISNWTLSDAEEYSAYVEMRDGVRIAVQVVLPPPDQRAEQIPAVVILTRYGRGTKFALARVDRSNQVDFLKLGFAIVSVDVRGSGASFGNRAGFNAAEEILNWEEVLDTGEIFDWVIAQRWSDGNITATGVSYPGNTSELAQVANHAALKAVAPRFTDFDLYDCLLFPGGAPDIAFTHSWGDLTARLDRGDPGDPSVTGSAAEEIRKARWVDGDDGSLYAAAVAEHAQNVDFRAESSRITFRDDLRSEHPPAHWRSTNVCAIMDLLAPVARPAFHWASWLDAGTAAGALARFSTLRDAPMIVRIGAWSHGATQDANPFTPADLPVSPSGAAQAADIAAFFLDAINGNKRSRTRAIEYFTMVANCWRSTPQWPPAGLNDVVWFPVAGGRLGRAAEESSPQAYRVDFEAGTGEHTRWSTQLGGPVDYLDRRVADQKLLTYTSEAFDDAMEITGTPLVSLYVQSENVDGLFIAYLEDVDPEGRVTYVTEGVLRGIHRSISENSPPYEHPGPHRSFLKCDASPLPVDEVVELTFPMLPTSVVIERGHRIRIAFSGADKNSFEAVPATKNQHWQVHMDAKHRTRIVLPMRKFVLAKDAVMNAADLEIASD
jgi:putative CocE/NonD family hydrolase